MFSCLNWAAAITLLPNNTIIQFKYLISCYNTINFLNTTLVVITEVTTIAQSCLNTFNYVEELVGWFNRPDHILSEMGATPLRIKYENPRCQNFRYQNVRSYIRKRPVGGKTIETRRFATERFGYYHEVG